jgi:hypothetical protein
MSGRILAPHRLWFGLEDREVRRWWVPFALADPRYGRIEVYRRRR